MHYKHIFTHCLIGYWYYVVVGLESGYCADWHNAISYSMLHVSSYECNTQHLWWLSCLWAALYMVHKMCLLLAWSMFSNFCNGNMALLIQYFHMDAVRSIQLGCSYFANPDYLVITLWMITVVQHPNHITLPEPTLYRYMKTFLTVTGYTLPWILCHGIVVTLSIFNILITAYPAPCFQNYA